MKIMNMRNVKRAAAAMLCGVMFLVGCGRSDSLPEDRQWSAESVDTESAGQSRLSMIEPKAYSRTSDLKLEPGTLISVILKSSDDDPYWDQVRAGVRQAEKELNETLGYTGDDEIKVQISGPSTAEDAEDQINLLDEELDSNPNAIVISLIDADACQVQFDLASENGIPIVTMDSGSAYSGIATTCSTDNAAAAVKAAKEMCKLIEDKGEIALIVHDSISETAQLREKAFRREIKKNHPDVKIVKIIHGNQLDECKQEIADERNGVTSDDAKSAEKAEKNAADDAKGTEDDAQAQGDNAQDTDTEEEDPDEVHAEDISDTEVIQWLIQKYPDLKGIFTSNDKMAELLCSDTDDAEKIKEMSVISFDAGEKQLDNLENDMIDGLIVQNPYGMGYASVVAAARTILGESNESVIDTGYVWATKSNITGQEIKNLLYE